MARHIACLSFDFDAWSGLTARGLTTPTPISRGEFCAVAVPRILKLLDKHKITSTFFIPGIVMETYPDLTRQIHDSGHELGNHGWTHFPPSTLEPAEEEYDLVRSSDLVESLTGRRPTGYRSASFDLSPVTAELLEKHGFVYESSMMGHDHSPYFIRIGDKVDPKKRLELGRTSKLVELPVSWNLDDFPHFEFLRTPQQLMPGLQWAGGVLQNWTEDFQYMHQTEEWGALIFTFHPYVIGRGHRMIMLEKLIVALQEMNAVWLSMEATALEFLKREGR